VLIHVLRCTVLHSSGSKSPFEKMILLPNFSKTVLIFRETKGNPRIKHPEFKQMTQLSYNLFTHLYLNEVLSWPFRINLNVTPIDRLKTIRLNIGRYSIAEATWLSANVNALFIINTY
jgi:hypothetical protein